MRNILSIALIMLSTIVLSGCNNLSPRDNLSPQLQQEIRDIKDSQSNLENNQNVIKAEIGRLQNSMPVSGNENQVQQGWLNIQADGILIAAFAISTIAMLLYYMFRSAHYKKAAELMSGQVRNYDNELKERIMAAAWKTDVEKTIYTMID